MSVISYMMFIMMTMHFLKMIKVNNLIPNNKNTIILLLVIKLGFKKKKKKIKKKNHSVYLR